MNIEPLKRRISGAVITAFEPAFGAQCQGTHSFTS